MKTIGLIGGMSWQSSIEYYRIINETVQARLGGHHSARCVLYSVDFAGVEALLRQDRWADLADRMAAAAQSVAEAGADFLVICTNTVHKVAEEVQARVGIPLLHIADAAAEEIKARGLKTVGLLGTKVTMEDDFYRARLAGMHGLEVVVPPAPESQIVHRVIFEELCLGRILEASRQRYVEIMAGLAERGAEGIILGCTEIGLLVRPEDSPLPLFDTARIHAVAAAEYALAP